MSFERRVVVTGMGVISPVGNKVEDFWNNLAAGKSGITKLSIIDPEPYPSKIAGQVLDFDPSPYIDAKEARRMDRFTQFAVSAAVQAVEDSKLDPEQEDPSKVGVIIGSGIGGMQTFQDQYKTLLDRGASRVSPFFIPMLISDISSGIVSIRYNAQGPNYSVSSACATASHAIGSAFRAIKFGDADVMISGGAEAGIVSMGLAGFCSMKALCTGFNDEPEKGSRPFDKKRCGFVIAEGSGVVVLEELEHALKRGATIYGEIKAVGMSADAHHMVAPHPEGRGAEIAMKKALEQGGVKKEQINYINAHGTSTHLGDISEVMAVKRLFGEDAKVMLCSTKSMTGHTLGAAGAIELIATLLAMRNSLVPPTINQEEPDPECQVDCVPNVARKANVDYALSNSFGFGGHNASVLVAKYPLP
jgi:3-oxoacyl-[acyl-carrier-protein] synthase II